MTVEEFRKSKNPKKISALEKFKNEIFELKNQNFSQASIVIFLKKNGIETTQQNISSFLKTDTCKDNIKNIVKDTKEQNKTQVEAVEKPKSKQKIKILAAKNEIKNLEFAGTPDWAK